MQQRELAITLWRQTWPMAIGVLALLGFQLVDSAFIARLGTAQLAAQSFTFPLSFLIIGIQVGMGIAIAALISRALGAGEGERARRLSSLVLMAGGGVIGLLAIILWLFHVPIFRLLGADATTLSYIYIYWGPQLLSAWLGALLYFSYSVFRAHGDTRLPGKMMVLSSLVNLVLDPLLIFGVGDWEGWGLPGAAWATAIAFSVGLLVTTRKLHDHVAAAVVRALLRGRRLGADSAAYALGGKGRVGLAAKPWRCIGPGSSLAGHGLSGQSRGTKRADSADSLSAA